MDKKAQGGASSMNTQQTLRNIEQGINKMDEMLRNFETERNNLRELYTQLSAQVNSLEQANAKLTQMNQAAQQATTTQTADDAEPKQRKWWHELLDAVLPDPKMENDISSGVAGVRGSIQERPLSKRAYTEDDEEEDELEKAHKNKCPAFWRRNLDYGSR